MVLCSHLAPPRVNSSRPASTTNQPSLTPKKEAVDWRLRPELLRRRGGDCEEERLALIQCYEEVKLVKCFVQNIVVDISFHQIGGLRTLCFLEQVLYRFLDYYSKFDWDNKGISLYGSISLSSLPELVTNSPGIYDDIFLEREEILKQCAESFTVPPSHYEKNTRRFSRKFLNIVDPVKQSNNLGRSVSKGNF